MSSSVNIAPFKLAGIQKTGPSSFNKEENAGADFGNKLWHEFIDKVIAAGIPLEQDMYGVSWPADDQTPPQLITYFCGFKSNAPVDEFELLEVEGGNYFEYRFEGYAVDVDKGFQDAYMNAFLASGLKGRAGQHLEIYGEEYDPNAPISIFRILIPAE
jgi:predicted transcriptional regulator YdeE